jgi:polyphosphate kinase
MTDLLATAHKDLHQAQQQARPLAERLRAISRMAQRLDQFFLTSPLAPSAASAGPSATARERNEIAALLTEAGLILRQQILPCLQRQSIYLMPVEQLGEQQQQWLFAYFRQWIYPLLTPLAVDPGHPFPYISSESLNLLVLLQRPGHLGGRTLYARLKVPRQATPRLIDVPPLAVVDSPVLYNDSANWYWVWSEEVVRFFVHELFAGMSVTGIYQFRVLRTGSHGRRQAALRDRRAPVVRVDIQQEMPPAVVHWLLTQLDASPHTLFRCTTPLGLGDWAEVARRLESLPHYSGG